MTIYADTDFILAIAKKEDWLKTNARKIYNENKGDIETSIATVIEAALVANRKGITDFESLFGSIFEIANVEGVTKEECMEVAHLIQNEKLNIFDAFHAVLSRGKPIASSEHIYDKIGKQRIKLEEK